MRAHGGGALYLPAAAAALLPAANAALASDRVPSGQWTFHESVVESAYDAAQLGRNGTC